MALFFGPRNPYWGDTQRHPSLRCCKLLSCITWPDLAAYEALKATHGSRQRPTLHLIPPPHPVTPSVITRIEALDLKRSREQDLPDPGVLFRQIRFGGARLSWVNQEQAALSLSLGRRPPRLSLFRSPERRPPKTKVCKASGNFLGIRPVYRSGRPKTPFGEGTVRTRGAGSIVPH